MNEKGPKKKKSKTGINDNRDSSSINASSKVKSGIALWGDLNKEGAKKKGKSGIAQWGSLNKEGPKKKNAKKEISTNADSGHSNSNTMSKVKGEIAQPIANDNLSIFVGEVDYEATPEELHGHFESCGCINLVTIPLNQYSKKPRGFAYIEFVEKAGMQKALLLDASEFRGRKLKVLAKRKNIYGYNASRGRGSYYGRRRGGYRGRGRGGYRRKRRGGYHRRGRGGKFGGYMYESSSLII